MTVYDTKLKNRQRQLHKTPDDPDALVRLGEMYFVVENWDEALAYFQRAVLVAPEHALAHMYCGAVARATGDFETAERHLRESAALAPEFVDPQLELAQLYARMEDGARLAEALERAGDTAGTNPDAHVLVAYACFELGRADDASAHVARALDLDGDNVAALLLAGRLLEASGDGAQAAERYRDALRVEPENAEARGRLAILGGGEDS